MDSEAKRLEELWAGTFGASYITRNRSAGGLRGSAWARLLEGLAVGSALEVGCNIGANLEHLAPRVDGYVVGVDINRAALHELAGRTSALAAVAAGRKLPFRDASFDLVMTVGVLIHQPEASLHEVMAEIVRCSRRYVICGEYEAENDVEVPYRGQRGALFKRDYGRLYEERFHLNVLSSNTLGPEDGFDNVTFHVFEQLPPD